MHTHRILKKIDLHYLERYPSFRKFQHSNEHAPNTAETDTIHDDKTPIETIEAAYALLREDLSKTLIQSIAEHTPAFFERLVIDLLIAMGYGYDKRESGIVVGGTGDNGIDGIISEDKLGFSQVYVQAKRWDSDKTIGSPEVQAFAGALLGKGASKGLFITTAKFSNAARSFVKEQKAVRIVLVDGEELAGLMIDHGIGVSNQKVYSIKQLDKDYFDQD